MDDSHRQVELWRMKRSLEMLKAAKGNGTSVITIYIPPRGEQLLKMTKMLNEEIGTASNIKSRANRQAVMSAISSVQNRLKLFNNKVPSNGVAIFCGLVETNEQAEKKIILSLEPLHPIPHSVYLCDSRFHTEMLESQLDDNADSFGFIVIDGNGTLCAILTGERREILRRLRADLPCKHRRGGQSALRFARLREHARHHYVSAVAEMVNGCFLSRQDGNGTEGSATLRVQGIVLAGSADLKMHLLNSQVLSKQVRGLIQHIVDISYGGVAGLNEAIERVADQLSNYKYLKEKNLVQRLFEEIATGGERVCYGVEETMRVLTDTQGGAIQSLLVWDALRVERSTCRSSNQNDNSQQIDGSEVLDRGLLLDWLVENYEAFGCELHLISDHTSEGAQFVYGFGGMAALLRYPVLSVSDDSDGVDSGSYADDALNDDHLLEEYLAAL